MAAPRDGRIYTSRTLTSQQRMRFAYSLYGDFPVFRKDLGQLFSPDFRHGGLRRGAAISSPGNDRAVRHGGHLDADLLMRADLQTYLSENCLVKTDRATMLASLEVRVPFLDELVLDRIVPLPATAKIPGGQLKALLLPLARRLLPREVWDRPKKDLAVRSTHGWRGCGGRPWKRRSIGDKRTFPCLTTLPSSAARAQYRRLRLRPSPLESVCLSRVGADTSMRILNSHEAPLI